MPVRTKSFSVCKDAPAKRYIYPARQVNPSFKGWHVTMPGNMFAVIYNDVVFTAALPDSLVQTEGRTERYADYLELKRIALQAATGEKHLIGHLSSGAICLFRDRGNYRWEAHPANG